MKTRSTCIFTLIQLLNVHADVLFEQRTERESLVLTSSRQCDAGCPASLALYHRSAHSQTTLLSMAAGDPLRLDPGNRRRLRTSGDLSSPQVSVTVSDLKHSDTGLYVWELKYRRNDSELLVITSPTVLLLVDGGGASCSSVAEYRTLLVTISTAAGLLLLTLIWLFAEKHVTKRIGTRRPSTLAPIYEEMRKQQNSQNNASSRQQEVDSPLYANPNIRQCPENYYACPRQVALKA